MEWPAQQAAGRRLCDLALLEVTVLALAVHLSHAEEALAFAGIVAFAVVFDTLAGALALTAIDAEAAAL